MQNLSMLLRRLNLVSLPWSILILRQEISRSLLGGRFGYCEDCWEGEC